MRIALIPPHSLIAQTNKTNYQLMLPQEYSRLGSPYNWRYNAHLKDTRQFVILDNGAAEGCLYSMNDLMRMAALNRVDEMVLPDVLGNAEDTIELALRFERTYVPGPNFPPPTFGLMFVAQGRTPDEFRSTIAWAHTKTWITTIGIPRHTITTLNAKYARINLALWMDIEFGEACKPIHFLGGSELFHNEVVYLSDESIIPQRIVRGMDTSMPFNYAYAGIALDDDGPKPTKRPDGYFDLDSQCFDKELVTANVDFFIRHHKQ